MIEQIATAGISRRGFLGGAVVAVAGLGLAGCGSQGAPGSGSAAADSYRDELNIAIEAMPPTLDTVMTASTATVDVMANVLEPLFALDASYAAKPVLATGTEVSDDGLTVKVSLRRGIKFHNGEEMTAEDVAASMNRWLSNGTRAQSLLPGASFAATGDAEVTCTLTQPASDFETVLGMHSQYAGIVPVKSIEAAGEDGLSEFIGTGAYKLDEVKQDQYIHLVRNDAYAPADGEPSGFTGHASAPTKELYYQIVTDADTRVSGIQTGEYDIACEIPTESYQDLSDDGNVKLRKSNGGVLEAFLNTSTGIMANEKLRQAVLAAIDAEAVATAAYGEKELFTLDGGFMNPDNEQWATDAGTDLYNQADAERAKKLLEEAGYAGETVHLLTTPDYKEMYNATVAIQDQLESAGFTCEVDSYEFSTFMDVRTSKPDQWDLFVASISYQVTPAQSLTVSPDFYALSDEEALKLVAETRTASTHEEALEKWGACQKRLYETAATTALCHYLSLSATAADVEGFQSNVGSIVWNAKRPA